MYHVLLTLLTYDYVTIPDRTTVTYTQVTVPYTRTTVPYTRTTVPYTRTTVLYTRTTVPYLVYQEGVPVLHTWPYPLLTYLANPTEHYS